MKVIEYFCGMGGATAGILAAGGEVVVGVDHWPVACAAHKRWHPETPVVCACVESNVIKVDCDLVWASPSCKPYSLANRIRRGTDHKEYYPLAELVRQAFGGHRARWLVIENVGGLVWSREGKEELARLTAEVARWSGLRYSLSIIAASSLSVAQLRRRVFIVVGPTHVRVRNGGEWIPSRDPGRQLFDVTQQITQPAPMARKDTYGSYARMATRAIGTHPSGERPDSASSVQRYARRGVCHSVSARLPSRDGTVEFQGAWGNRLAVRSPCASESVRNFGSNPHTDEINHRGRTLAECCQLQQVPLHIVEGLPKSTAHTLVGNCVPPPMAEHVIRTVMAYDRELGLKP